MASFQAHFPEIFADDERIKKINEDEMKSPEGKTKWRALLKEFETMGQSQLSLVYENGLRISQTPHVRIEEMILIFHFQSSITTLEL